MASEGPRRLCRQARRACLHGRRAGKYDGVYLPSYTIYTFAIIYPFVIPFVIYPRCLFISDDLVFLGVLPAKSGLPYFPLASSSMQLRALVGWCWVALTTVERHSERFNTGFVPVSIFHCCWCIVCFNRAL